MQSAPWFSLVQTGTTSSGWTKVGSYMVKTFTPVILVLIKLESLKVWTKQGRCESALKKLHYRVEWPWDSNTLWFMDLKKHPHQVDNTWAANTHNHRCFQRTEKKGMKISVLQIFRSFSDLNKVIRQRCLSRVYLFFFTPGKTFAISATCGVVFSSFKVILCVFAARLFS